MLVIILVSDISFLNIFLYEQPLKCPYCSFLLQLLLLLIAKMELQT